MIARQFSFQFRMRHTFKFPLSVFAPIPLADAVGSHRNPYNDGDRRRCLSLCAEDTVLFPRLSIYDNNVRRRLYCFAS
jgi:hypothetical protein